MRHINDDDLSVIVVDRGMVDDHLPNNVLSALKRCQKKLVGSLYNAEEMQTMREEKIARITREKGISLCMEKLHSLAACGDGLTIHNSI